jgi:hypothetical protein
VYAVGGVLYSADCSSLSYVKITSLEPLTDVGSAEHTPSGGHYRDPK